MSDQPIDRAERDRLDAVSTLKAIHEMKKRWAETPEIRATPLWQSLQKACVEHWDKPADWPRAVDELYRIATKHLDDAIAKVQSDYHDNRDVIVKLESDIAALKAKLAETPWEVRMADGSEPLARHRDLADARKQVAPWNRFKMTIRNANTGEDLPPQGGW